MAAQPGFGSIITAATMMDTFTGWPDRPPVAPTTYYTDMLAPLFAALAISAALDYKRRTGKGQYIDHSQVEAGLNYLTPLVLDYQANQRIMTPSGNKCDTAAPHGIYRCKGEDRWVAIAVMSDEEWQSFKKITGNPEWANDPKFETASSRVKYSDELDFRVEEWTRDQTPERVMAILQGAKIGAGVVSNARDMDNDVQLNYQNFYRQLDHPFMGRVHYYHPAAIKLSKAETQVKRPVLLGEHTDFICSQILGMSQTEIDRLREKGVFK
jgi:benzylsuccinate CoA-transferase BbsF subunit